MSTSSPSTPRTGTISRALRTGVALAATVATFYALCALAWLVAPAAFMDFMTGLFHGIDFRPLVRAAPFSWAGFLEALAVMSGWAFLAGSFFGWLRERLGT